MTSKCLKSLQIQIESVISAVVYTIAHFLVVTDVLGLLKG